MKKNKSIQYPVFFFYCGKMGWGERILWFILGGLVTVASQMFILVRWFKRTAESIGGQSHYTGVASALARKITGFTPGACKRQPQIVETNAVDHSPTLEENAAEEEHIKTQ